MFLQWEMLSICVYVASSVNVFHAMFCIIFMKFDVILVSFSCYFGIILVVFRCPHPKTEPGRDFFDFGFILKCLWEPSGHPYGGLLGVYFCRRASKTASWTNFRGSAFKVLF
jgi:hypothetical protein